MNTEWSSRLGRLPLRCVKCGAEGLIRETPGFSCPACPAVYPLQSGKLFFKEPRAADGAGPDPAGIDRLKRALKRFPALYGGLQRVVSPIYHDGTHRRFFRENVTGRADRVCLNLGSGNLRLDGDLINIDAEPYDQVDVVSDVSVLPFADATVDVVVSVSLLEHVPDPERVLDEIRRVLKPGGLVLTDIPFVCGYHAAPGDYRRWTHEGVILLHRGFDAVELVNKGGPTSALLWVGQEWLATVFSFGSRRLHSVVYLLAMAATFPLKYLDALLNLSPTSRNISSCFVYIGRKRHESP